MAKYSNFKARAIFSILAIAFVVGITLYSQPLFTAFFFIAGGVVLSEMLNAAREKGLTPNRYLAYLLYLVVFIAWTRRPEWLPAALMVGIYLAFGWELFRKKPNVLASVGVVFLGAVYTGLVFATFVRFQQMTWGIKSGAGPLEGGRVLLTIFIGVWSCDILAYMIGTPWGRHKIFPRVSPKKSWEGTLGGIGGAALGVFISGWSGLMPAFSISTALWLTFFTGVMGQVGDFAESLVKRDAGLKDSSNLIPGHGGAWDRLDSLMFAVPMAYLYFQLTGGIL